MRASLHWHGLGRLLRRALPPRPAGLGPGRKPLPMEDLALGFMTGILAGAQKLAQVAHLRADPMLAPLASLCRQDAIWHPTPVPGTEVAEIGHREHGWDRERRVILVRHRIEEKARPGGKKLLDVPGCLFQAFVTNLPASVPPIAVWRDYNPRAGCEGVIKPLDADFALDKLCLKGFFATEAAMSLAVFAYNLCVLFQRHLGCLERVTAATLRFRLFTTGGIISRSNGRTTIRLAVPAAQRDWWRTLFEKTLSPWPNCNSFCPDW